MYRALKVTKGFWERREEVRRTKEVMALAKQYSITISQLKELYVWQDLLAVTILIGKTAHEFVYPALDIWWEVQNLAFGEVGVLCGSTDSVQVMVDCGKSTTRKIRPSQVREGLVPFVLRIYSLVEMGSRICNSQGFTRTIGPNVTRKSQRSYLCRLTISVVEILNMKGKLSTLDDIPVELIPLSQSRQLWTREPSERTKYNR